MGRNAKWSAEPDAKLGDLPTAGPLTPTDVAKKQFAQRLWTLIRDRGWNQSELARAAGLGRDIISVYVNGKSLPEPKNAKKLSDALGVTMAELMPHAVERGIEQHVPRLEIRQATGSDRVWLRVNTETSINRAARVMAILEEEDPSGA